MIKFLKKLFGASDAPLPPKPTRLPTPLPPSRSRTSYRETPSQSKTVDNTDYVTPMMVATMFSDHGGSSHSHDSSSYDSGSCDSGGCDGGGGCD